MRRSGIRTQGSGLCFVCVLVTYESTGSDPAGAELTVSFIAATLLFPAWEIYLKLLLGVFTAGILQLTASSICSYKDKSSSVTE